MDKGLAHPSNMRSIVANGTADSAGWKKQLGVKEEWSSWMHALKHQEQPAPGTDRGHASLLMHLVQNQGTIRFQSTILTEFSKIQCSDLLG